MSASYLDSIGTEGIMSALGRRPCLGFRWADELSDEPIGFVEAQKFVATLRYPNATFELTDTDALSVRINSFDVLEPSRRICFRSRQRLVGPGWTRRQLATTAMAVVLIYVVHEAREFFRVDAERPFQPHRGGHDGFDLFEMTSVARDACDHVEQDAHRHFR